ncbi:MFS transporter [Burkholderia sp. WAC0059]|uniref:MFS transporter n=1 Tax=Burkholderia sp. WAC0059 TaxID=2066022 RepID=UPI000C7F1525|nr:MFS transporter [Burkholderia sp. WAC0059]PLZ00108.1 MFS transporter [Burkholderia sp. WAC0059]
MHDIESRTMRKVLRRFVPLLVVCFVVASLDRVNVGFAALTMSHDLGFTSTVFGLGSGLFFIGYFFFEVPSNVALERYGARRWIARIMLTWGVLSAANAFIVGERSFYFVRVLLGMAEAGFFPGVILFMTWWIPVNYRARVVGAFMAAMPFASVIGAPVSGWLLGRNGVLGLQGWQLLFIVEALPSLLLAGVVLAVLRDRPADAEWLDDDERQWLVRRLETDGRQGAAVSESGFWNIVKRPMVLVLSAAYFGIVGSNFGLSFYLPQIVHAFHLTYVQTGCVAAIPFAVGGFGMMWWGRRSDRHDERRFHLLLPMGLAVIGLAGSTFAPWPPLELALLSVGCFGIYSTLPVYWATVSRLLSPAVAAVGLAVINSLANLSGFAAPYLIGAIKDATGSTAGGLQAIAAYGCITFVLLAGISRHAARSPRQDVGAGERVVGVGEAGS